MKKIAIASDYDGTYDVLEEARQKAQVIITGRTPTDPRPLKLDIPIFLNPEPTSEPSLLSVIKHKANIINTLKVELFYEDQKVEFTALKKLCPSCRFILVPPQKEAKKKYDYLIYSRIGLSLFLIPHLCLSDEVERIYFVCPDLRKPSIGKNMNKFEGWEKLKILPTPDPNIVLCNHDKESLIILIDDVGMGGTADFWRRNGWKVVGGSQMMDKFENDRTFGTNLMSKIMKVPESFPFKSFDDGIEFLHSQEKGARFVFKPDNADVPKEYTYVSSSINDMLAALKEFRAKWAWDESFQLQVVIDGQECDANLWFNGKDYVSDIISFYFENKKVLTGDLGAAGGGEIAVQFSRKASGPYWDIFQKLKPFLQKTGYVGQVALNTMVSKEDHLPYFLEVTARFGYPSMPLDITMIEENGNSMHDFFKTLVNAERKDFYPLNLMSAVLNVATPPYPHGDEKGIAKGVPLFFDKKWWKYMFPFGILYDEKRKTMALSEGDGYALNVTCASKSLDEAVKMIYDVYVPTIKLINKEYRKDLGESAKERITILKEWEIFT